MPAIMSGFTRTRAKVAVVLLSASHDHQFSITIPRHGSSWSQQERSGYGIVGESENTIGCAGSQPRTKIFPPQPYQNLRVSNKTVPSLKYVLLFNTILSNFASPATFITRKRNLHTAQTRPFLLVYQIHTIPRHTASRR
jgi:hypothetical protein